MYIIEKLTSPSALAVKLRDATWERNRHQNETLWRRVQGGELLIAAARQQTTVARELGACLADAASLSLSYFSRLEENDVLRMRILRERGVTVDATRVVKQSQGNYRCLGTIPSPHTITSLPEVHG